MQPLNTLPIENFLEKSRIARKSGQRTLTIPVDEATQLEESLAVIMTRLAGELDALVANSQDNGDITIKMDGGSL